MQRKTQKRWNLKLLDLSPPWLRPSKTSSSEEEEVPEEEDEYKKSFFKSAENFGDC